MSSIFSRPDAPTIGPYQLNRTISGDAFELIDALPDESLDVVITSPPYWGQRMGSGVGNEADPREYLRGLGDFFASLLPKLKTKGLLWINLGDAYNTPVNWRLDDRTYSTLGPDGDGLGDENSAYVKPRAKRKAFIETDAGWLSYGNLLALPYRLVINLTENGYIYRGEVIWKKRNAMPEGRCRRPHRRHESIYLLARSERHGFRTAPPVGSVWEFGNERIKGKAHYSRFPLELPLRCIDALGRVGSDVVVCDPFAGSGTVGLAARELGCSYIGFEIEEEQTAAANERLAVASWLAA
ncbi:MAG: site-specific DNA-methyltransferase [Actinomycetota bacterium]|nr:site-specific DNA-methyltransferase [Actinomycetota bacterium]